MSKRIRTIKDLQPDPGNHNDGTARGLQVIEHSLEAYGPGRSVLADSDGRILAGNKTLQVAAEMGIPIMPIHTTGEALVVVIRDDLASDDPRAEGIAIADNRASELGLAWNAQRLLESAQRIDVSAMFNTAEMEALKAKLRQATRRAQKAEAQGVNPAEALRDKWQTELGQVWALGEHRLACGDATDTIIAHGCLASDARIHAVITDPPYGQDREGIANDEEAGLESLYAGMLDASPMTDGILIAFQSPKYFPHWLDAIRAAGYTFERSLWMHKSNDVTQPWRGWMMNGEQIAVATVGNPTWPQDIAPVQDCYVITHDLTVGHIPHPSVKPLRVVESLMAHTSGDVYDPFSGSGTTILAAQALGRRCYAVELDPAYVAIALERWAADTGINPVMVSVISG